MQLGSRASSPDCLKTNDAAGLEGFEVMTAGIRTMQLASMASR
jgi:hypothetical protein